VGPQKAYKGGRLEIGEVGFFYRPDALPVSKPTVSKHCVSWGISRLSFLSTGVLTFGLLTSEWHY